MLTKERVLELNLTANEIRKEIIKTIASIGVGHVGGSLSIADLLAVLYFDEMKVDPKNPKWDGRDCLVCSKGHAGPAIYSALCLRGFFDKDMLYTLNKPNTNLPSHCDMKRTPGIDMTTGSLGQGTSTATGIALGNKMDGKDDLYTYLIVGDGESQEGQVWEAAMFAAHYKLGNLIAFVDCNKLQIDGKTDDVMSLGDVVAKFKAFGWDTVMIDGHNVEAIHDAIETAKQTKDKPHMIILDTVKGTGVSFMTNSVDWHGKGLNDEEYAVAMQELNAAYAALEQEDK